LKRREGRLSIAEALAFAVVEQAVVEVRRIGDEGRYLLGEGRSSVSE
jgi:hypothetical protein